MFLILISTEMRNVKHPGGLELPRTTFRRGEVSQEFADFLMHLMMLNSLLSGTETYRRLLIR